jgi:hypothetical protein
MTRTMDYAKAYSTFYMDFHRNRFFSADAWMDKYQNFDLLPIAEKFALIHPDFWGVDNVDTREARRRNHPIHPDHSFSSIAHKRKCATPECPWESQEWGYEAGHIWPDKFGGPQIPQNGECQCFMCNRMSGFSIENLPWDRWDDTPPDWLSYMAQQISIKHSS